MTSGPPAVEPSIDAPTKTQLYRHFDSSGTLLYVGISLSSINRLSQHKDHSNWFSSIARVEIESFESRELALAAERLAIQTEKPLHNIHCRKKLASARHVGRRDRVEASEQALTEKIVKFDVLYSVKDFPLPLRRAQILEYMDSGKLGYFELPNATGTKVNRYVSGWQLIEFMEWLGAQPNATRQFRKSKDTVTQS